MYFSLIAFHFHIFSQDFLTFTLFRLGISLFLHISVLCLGSPCHPTANTKPTHFNPLSIALYTRCSGVQNIITHLALRKNNGRFFIHCYTKTEIISSMQGHSYQHPDNQLVKTSHSGVAGHSSLLIFLFKKQFPSLGFLTCIQCLGLLPLPTTPTQHLPTKVLG
jgi:hypothetical protein